MNEIKNDWLKAWRKALKLTQKEAAFLLGIKPRMLQNYESGTHGVPRYIQLAMIAINQGVVDVSEGVPVYTETHVALFAARELGGKKDVQKKLKKLEPPASSTSAKAKAKASSKNADEKSKS